MPGLVEGKAGLVTGSAGGIGRATALALAREGAAGVLVTDLPSRQEDGEETVHLIEQEGGHAVFVAGDVTVAADCQAVVAQDGRGLRAPGLRAQQRRRRASGHGRRHRGGRLGAASSRSTSRASGSA